MPPFLRVCKKSGKKTETPAASMKHPFGPKNRKELRHDIRCKGTRTIPGNHEQGAAAQGLPLSKRTAHYLLQFNLIPHVCTGKKTRCYAIKKRDVIDFMINREVNPSRYIVPTGWYKYGNEDVKPYKIRIQPPFPGDPQKTRRYYESKLASYPDVIDVAAVVDFTGYNRHTVCEWIRFGKLRALALQHKYMIPKCYLIDWLSTDEHNATTRKSRRHIDRLWELQKWSDGQ